MNGRELAFAGAILIGWVGSAGAQTATPVQYLPPGYALPGYGQPGYGPPPDIPGRDTVPHLDIGRPTRTIGPSFGGGFGATPSCARRVDRAS